MSTSKVSLCNLALAKLGLPAIIDLEQPSSSAEACNLLYSPALEYVLRQDYWRFAIKKRALAPLDETATEGLTELLTEYAYGYLLPEELIKLEKIEGITDYDLVGDRYLLCNEATITIKYVYKNETTSTYTTDFIDLFVIYLAHLLAPTLVGGNVARELLQEYLLKLPKTGKNNSGENMQPITSNITSWDRAKYAGTRVNYPLGTIE